jgi:hypothetical protein
MLSLYDEQQRLHEALGKLEASVETPFVPGEFERWIAEVESAWRNLQPGMELLITTRHPQDYAEIRQEDLELIPRVEQMRQEDAEIQRQADLLERQIPRLTAAVAHVEPDEGRLTPRLDAFAHDALSLIIRVRKQEQAVRTWLGEAFNRDRGTVD